MFDGNMRDGRFDGKFLSIRTKAHHCPQMTHLPAGDTRLPEPTHMVAMAFAIPCGQESIKRLPNGPLSGAAKHLLRRMVEQDDPLILIYRDNRIHCGFNDAFEPQLADQKLFLGFFATDDGANGFPICVVPCLLRLHHQSFGMGSLHTFGHQVSLRLH